MAFSGPLPPVEFNMARYALEPGPDRPADKVALIVISDNASLASAETWTYGDLHDCVLRIAAGLCARGLRPGDRIMIRLANTSDYALLFFGALAGGFVPLPASAALSAREVSFLFADSGCAAIALDPALPVGALSPGAQKFGPAQIAELKAHAPAETYAPTKREDPAFLVYTSGTTANPKGVLHAHRSAWGRRPMYQGWYGIGPGDRMLHSGAFNWTFTIGVGLTDPWANGATTVIYNGPRDPAVWPAIIAKHQITLLAAVPGVYRQILKYGDVDREQMASLRHGLIAGERIPSALAEEWRARTGKLFYEALGMSEISTYISSSPSVPPKPGAIGKPQAGRDVTILPVEAGETPLPRGETGVIAVHRSDPGLMLGYWNRPEEEQAVFRGDWFLTGDLGIQDDEGYISHQGRTDDLMNALGYRVSPDEIEQILSSHPDIAEIAAAEISVRPDLNVIGAFVVARDGADPDGQSILDFAEARLAAYKVPKEVVFLKALPRNANGKVMRSRLAAAYAASGEQG